jgi:hypothetical protein
VKQGKPARATPTETDRGYSTVSVTTHGIINHRAAAARWPAAGGYRAATPSLGAYQPLASGLLPAAHPCHRVPSTGLDSEVSYARACQPECQVP